MKDLQEEKTNRRTLFTLLHFDTLGISVITPFLASQNLTRRPRIRRRHIKRRIAQEEVPRPEQQRHRLSRHDWIVFWAGKVDDAERVPEDDVFIVDLRIWIVCDPLR